MRWLRLLDILSPRLTLRQHSREQIEVERVLGIARACLAVLLLVALRLNSLKSSEAPLLVVSLVLLYLGHSVALLALLWRWTRVPRHFGWAVQSVDIVWPALVLLLFQRPPISPFLYLIFAITSAAFRWGMRGTMVTVLAEVLTLSAATGLELEWPARLPAPWSDIALQMGFVLVFGVLIGTLAEREKSRRAEIAGIFLVSSQARVDEGLKASLEGALREIRELFGANEIVLLTRAAGDKNSNLWRARLAEDGDEAITNFGPIQDKEAQPYFFELPARASGTAWTRGEPKSAIAIDRDGKKLDSECSLPREFLVQHPFNELLVGSVPFSPDVACRIFVFDARRGGGTVAQLHFLRQLASSVAPAIYNIYRLHRVHSRVAAAERARIARDLHDGVIQALHALAFRLYALRTGTRISEMEHKQELLEMQEIVQKEASQLRHMIQHLQPVELGPTQLVEFLSAMVERYRDDTGIAATFVCDASDLNLPAATCREIAGIVQEALANVHRHSGAENVQVHLTTQDDAWILTVEDDGRGFEFSGRRSLLELEQIRRGPLIIKQRVRNIGAELVIESRPGQGARLEIRFPVQANFSYDDDVSDPHSYRR